jgi:hypothetical protein
MLVTRAACVALVIASSHAHADKNACADASEAGQQQRIEGKLREARDKFVACSQSSCPAIVKRDCDQWLSEVDAVLPSIILVARDAGRDIAAVHVVIDNGPALDRLDGKAIAIDPGEHVVRFEIDGRPPVTERIVIHEGEKQHVVAVDLPPPPRVASHAPHESHWLRYGLLGLGSVALAAFTYLDISGQSTFDACHVSDACTSDEVSSLSTRRVVTWSAGGIATASLASAGVMFAFGGRF